MSSVNRLSSNSKCNTAGPNCYRRMSAEDREILSLGLAHGHSLRTMASVLGRGLRTMNRELARNASRDRPYRACTAQTLAAAQACQPRRPRKLLNPWLWQYVRTHLAQGCSPEQIAERLRRAYPVRHTPGSLCATASLCPWKSMRNCVIIHPLHLEVETAREF